MCKILYALYSHVVCTHLLAALCKWCVLLTRDMKLCHSLQEHGKDELDRWQLVRASEKFRVIALGLPVPPYKGNPLDPPLRSRFQARVVEPLPFQEQLDELICDFVKVPQKT